MTIHWGRSVATTVRVTARNARFQQWQALITNRTKRQRGGEFLVQGVRPITLAIQYGWTVTALLFDADRPRLSDWAAELLDTVAAPRYALSAELIGELGEKPQTPPELLATVAIARDDLDRLSGRSGPVVAFDRPANPGNVGTVIRSADAFGAAGVIVTGHAADPYDPRAVRASTGSLFAVPVVRVPGPDPALRWASANGLTVIGADEAGTDDIDSVDLTGPTLLVVGAESTGLSSGFKSACQRLVRIPIGGGASSLNAATATSIVLYECSRQRRMHVHDVAVRTTAGSRPDTKEARDG
jgi:TrmH family RNA methyltransferase